MGTAVEESTLEVLAFGEKATEEEAAEAGGTEDEELTRTTVWVCGLGAEGV